MTVVVSCPACGEEAFRDYSDGQPEVREVTDVESCPHCQMEDLLFDQGADARYDDASA